MTTTHKGINQYKDAIMLAIVKKWCILNPGKKALVARVTGSQVLTYDAGSKVFIYSPIKEPNYTVTVDEYPDWARKLYLNGTWDLIKESRLK